MKTVQVKSIVHDISHLLEDFSPMAYVFLQNKVEVDLLRGSIDYLENDDIYKFYKQKLEWFQNTINKFKGSLADFEYAKLRAYGNKECVKIIYKGKVFEGEILFKKESLDNEYYKVEDWLSWRDD